MHAEVDAASAVARRIDFRPAAVEDREWLFALHERCMRPMVERTFGQWDEALQRAKFAKRTETEVRIICLGAARVGAVHLEDMPDGSLLVGLIEIDPDRQNKGIGRAVLKRLAAEAAAGDRALTLRVRRANPAKRLYEQVGLRVTHSDATHFHLRLDPVQRSESGRPGSP